MLDLSYYSHIMAPINEGLSVTRENVQKILEKHAFKNLTEDELVLLLEGKKNKYLFNKPNMTPTDKRNMEQTLAYLQKNKMDTQENIKKLDAIKYGSNYIEIGGVKFSREKLVPQVKFNDYPRNVQICNSNTPGVFKIRYTPQEEYRLTTEAYIKECRKQGKTTITHDHIRKALQALPGEYSDNSRYQGANILGIVLNLSMSGYIGLTGLGEENGYGYLNSASPVGIHNTRTFMFAKDNGELRNDYSIYNARPCLFVVE